MLALLLGRFGTVTGAGTGGIWAGIANITDGVMEFKRTASAENIKNIDAELQRRSSDLDPDNGRRDDSFCWISVFSSFSLSIAFNAFLIRLVTKATKLALLN